MRKTLALVIASLLAPAALASSREEAAAQAAIAIAQAQFKKPVTRPVPYVLPYDIGANEAVARGCPLVTFVGCPQRELHGSGTVWCHADTLPGYDNPCIVISVPHGDWLAWKATLPASATAAEILAAFKPPPALATPAFPVLRSLPVLRSVPSFSAPC